MSARNIHRIAATLRRLEQGGGDGPCVLCGTPAVGWVQGTSVRPGSVCEMHGRQAETLGYTFNRTVKR